MDLPAELALKAFAGGIPLPGAWFKVHFPTSKNSVTLVLGPADGKGELKRNRDELVAEYERAVSAGLMDFGAPNDGIFVEVVNREDLPGLRHGFDVWAPPVRFPPNYLEELDQLDATLASVAGRTLTVVCAVPGHGSVRTTTREA